MALLPEELIISGILVCEIFVWCFVGCIIEIFVNFIVFLSSACNCNPEGSLYVSCNEYGECNCKFGVLGIKCGTCEENKHNLTAGCVSKYCYNAEIIIIILTQ